MSQDPAYVAGASIKNCGDADALPALSYILKLKCFKKLPLEARLLSTKRKTVFSVWNLITKYTMKKKLPFLLCPSWTSVSHGAENQANDPALNHASTLPSAK